MSKLLSKTQVKHINEAHSAGLQLPKVVLLLQDVTDAINVGSLFRTADAAGISKLILCGQTPTPPNQQLNTTARGLERSVEWEYQQDASQTIESLKQQGYQIVGIEIDTNSKSYFSVEYSNKVCLILGNEAQGIYKKNLPLCDVIVDIPMFGKGQSLNVNVSGAIVAYHIISQFN